jgi:hypothetical protein
MAHAKLSPSAAKRWLACPGSVALGSEVVDPGSRAADEGTAGHALFERSIRLGKRPRFWQDDIIEGVKVTQEMVEWVTSAVEWVKEYLRANQDAIVYTEEKVIIGPAIGVGPDDCFGTSDLFILTPHELVVFDLKLGYVPVEVEDNPQLELYALGFHRDMGGLFEQVRLVIHQPRAGGPKEIVVPTDALYAKARNTYEPGAKAALTAGAPLRASEDACRWCPAAALCPELQKQALEMARQEFVQVDTLSKDQMLLILEKAEVIETALKAVRSQAMKLLSLGQDIPGWKLVAGNKRRAWKDEEAVKKAMPELLVKELVTPPQAEKLVGKEKVAPFIHTPVGEATLVRQSDRRPALPPDFKVLE